MALVSDEVTKTTGSVLTWQDLCAGINDLWLCRRERVTHYAIPHVKNPLKLQVSKTLNALYAVQAYESSGCQATFDIDVRDSAHVGILEHLQAEGCLLYTSPSPRDRG